jgi:hypothetical protein
MFLVSSQLLILKQSGMFPFIAEEFRQNTEDAFRQFLTSDRKMAVLRNGMEMLE